MLPVDVAAHGVGRSGYAFLLWLNCVLAVAARAEEARDEGGER